jgi:AraC family transcriptional regulator
MAHNFRTHGQRTTFLERGEFFGSRRRDLSVSGYDLLDFLDDGAPVPRHTHGVAHVCFIVRGDYRTSANGFDGSCQGGALLYNPPGTTHQDCFARRGGRFLTLSFSRDQHARVCEAGSLPDHAVGLEERGIGFLGTRLLLETARSDGFSPMVVEGLALEILGHLQRPLPLADAGQPTWLRNACDLMHESSGEPLTIRDVAEAVGVHAVHLARGFRRFCRCTPGEYLRHVRVERALRRIRAGRSLADVAAECGFGDQSQLTKSFRRVLGHTPGAYRCLILS